MSKPVDVVDAAKYSRAKARHQGMVSYGLMFHLARAEEFFKVSLFRKLSHFERECYKQSLNIAEGIDSYVSSDWTGCARQLSYMRRRANRILDRTGIVRAEKFRDALAALAACKPTATTGD